MNKIVIANSGHGRQGKSTSIKALFEVLSDKYPDGTNIIKNHGDILATIRIGDILIGIESQGDPNSRMFDSLTMLREMGCNIIICACRTSGATLDKIKELHTKYGYELIFVSNPRTDNKELHLSCNKLYVEMVMQIISKVSNSKFPTTKEKVSYENENTSSKAVYLEPIPQSSILS